MKILFICKGNVGRSQMAEGLFNKMQSKHQASSAGIKLSGPECELEDLMPQIKEVIEVMKEEEIDVSKNKRKPLIDKMLKENDMAFLIMMEETKLPSYLKDYHNLVRWDIADPQGMDIDFTREVKNQIKEKILEVLKEINGSGPSSSSILGNLADY